MRSTPTSRSGWRARRRRSASSPTGSTRAGRSRSTRCGRTSTSRTAASRGCGSRRAATRRRGSHCRRRWTKSSPSGLAGTINYADANTRWRLLRPAVQPADARFVGRLPVAPQLGSGGRHQHGRVVPGLCAARHGLPDRADLPQARLRLGRQLPHPRRHALRMGRRATRTSTRTRPASARTPWPTRPIRQPRPKRNAPRCSTGRARSPNERRSSRHPVPRARRRCVT